MRVILSKLLERKTEIMFLGGLLLIVFISFVNIFPKGYIFSGGDVTQYINLRNNFGNLFYTWNSMGGPGAFLPYFSYSLFYAPFYLLNILAVSPSMQSFLYFFIFLSCSYGSFFLASKSFIGINRKRTFELRILLSLVYAINPYTLYVFTGIWGYSPFLVLYPLIPVIFGFTYSYFTNSSVLNKSLAALGIAFFLSNIAFGNIAFFVSLILFLMIFMMLLCILRLNKNRLKYKLIAYVSIFFAATLWTSVPSFFGLLPQYSTITSSEAVFNLESWILNFRLSILTQFFLVPNVSYFIGTFSFLFVLGAIGLFVLLAISLKSIKKISLAFLFLAAVSIFITAKGEGLLSNEDALKIFTLPILNILRSPDKTLVFLPFFFIIIMYIGIHDLYTKEHVDFSGLTKSYFKLHRLISRHLRKIVLISCLLVLLGVSPFFIGGIQTRYSFAFGSGQNYQTSSYSYLVHIPSDYYSAAKILSQDDRQDKILDLPYSVINSVGWVNYPTWKVVGVDPTAQLFSKPSIEANDASSPFWEEWNSVNVANSTWIIKLMSLYNVQYLIYHKDVAEEFINQTQDNINFLQNEGYINLIGDYTDFDLYNLSRTYFLPHIFPSSNITLVQGSSDQLLSAIISNTLTTNNAFFVSSQTTNQQWESLMNYNENYTNEKTNETTPQIIFEEINPTKYQVKIENATQPFFLVFSESYDPEWKAYIGNSETGFGNIIANYGNVGVEEANSSTSFTPGDINYLFEKSLPDSDHYMVNGYANAWYIDRSQVATDQNGTFEITLFYQPQSFYYVGLIVSGVTFMACIVYIVAQTALFRSLFSLIKKHLANKIITKK